MFEAAQMTARKMDFTKHTAFATRGGARTRRTGAQPHRDVRNDGRNSTVTLLFDVVGMLGGRQGLIFTGLKLRGRISLSYESVI